MSVVGLNFALAGCALGLISAISHQDWSEVVWVVLCATWVVIAWRESRS